MKTSKIHLGESTHLYLESMKVYLVDFIFRFGISCWRVVKNNGSLGISWVYHALDVEKIQGYPNHYSGPKWLEQLPKFNGDAHCVIHHVVSFLQYASEINVIHDDLLMNLFVHYLEGEQKSWVKYCSGPTEISSFAYFFKIFFKCWGPHLQKFEDVIATLQENEEASQASKNEYQELKENDDEEDQEPPLNPIHEDFNEDIEDRAQSPIEGQRHEDESEDEEAYISIEDK